MLNTMSIRQCWLVFLLVLFFVLANCSADLPTQSAGQNNVETGIPSFPWPPPNASSAYVLPKRYFEDARNLQAIDHLLSGALDSNGYWDKTYYRAPGGFVLITSLEQIDEQGYSLKDESRWSFNLPPLNILSIREILQALFAARQGRYRIIAFVVTDHAFEEDQEPSSASEIHSILTGGANVLPPAIYNQGWSDAHNVTALIYEFEKYEARREANYLASGRQPGRAHVERAGLIGALDRLSAP